MLRHTIVDKDGNEFDVNLRELKIWGKVEGNRSIWIGSTFDTHEIMFATQEDADTALTDLNDAFDAAVV